MKLGGVREACMGCLLQMEVKTLKD